MRRQSWAGTICCFVLFIVVFIFHKWLLTRGSPIEGRMDLGMLFFILPGIVASVFCRNARVVKPMLGAILASPLCLLLFLMWHESERSFWQELAWTFGAVFWCTLGALCYLLLLTLIKHYDAAKNRL
ncbi:inner membrane protein YbjM [Franconibacter daqui]|uniref:inner membrane protein YbjM n=1 Tax=Franconibacter daqui TaxID=2047724 RepID=UPI0030D1D1C3